MLNFDTWFCELISNHIWYKPASLHHKEETFRKVANAVYMQYVASEIFPPIQEARRHVYNKLALIPGDKPKVDWVGKALEKIKEEKEKEWVPVTGEERQRRLAEYKALIDSMPMVNAFPRVTEVEKAGDILPPKPEPYPPTTKEELYIKQRHFEYIKSNFEARSGQKLPSWISEEDWNIIYDEKHLTDKGL